MQRKISCMILITMLAFALSAEIVSRTQKIPLNSEMALLPNNYVLKASTCGKNEYGGYVYPCSSLSTSFDLFAAVEFNQYPCIFTCHNLAIGSPRPFYASRKPFFPIGILDLSDTGSFIKCDTVRGDRHIPTTPADDDRCFLPHLGNHSSNVSPVDSGCFLVIRTIVGLYSLVVLKPVFEQQSYQGETRYYINGFQVTWYFQTDGSLNFSGATGIGRHITSNVHPAVGMLPGTIDGASGCYTIRGQKITGTVTDRTLHRLLFVKNRNGSAQVILPGIIR